MAGRVDPAPEPAVDTQASAARARAVVMDTERRLGFDPKDRELEKLGYDIESRIPGTGRLRFIEVKGRQSDAETITATRNENLYSLNKPDDFILAIVEFRDDDTHRVRYVRRPFQSEPDFGAASVNYAMKDPAGQVRGAAVGTRLLSGDSRSTPRPRDDRSARLFPLGRPSAGVKCRRCGGRSPWDLSWEHATRVGGQDMVVTRIEALGFRSLRYVSQRLGPFHVLVGPNASGKSAFLDVLAFLGDLQRVGVGRAIAGDAARDVPLRAVDPQHLAWMRRGSTLELAVEVAVPDDLREGFQNAPPEVCRYEVAIDVSESLRIAVETLWLKPDGGPGARTRSNRVPQSSAAARAHRDRPGEASSQGLEKGGRERQRARARELPRRDV